MLLGVNIDHVATLRNARGEGEPSVINAAKICMNSGADGITAHLREDRRHIKDEDILALKNILKCRLNLEMAVTDEMQKIALDILPNSCCLVPEKRKEITTEGGLDVAGQETKIKNFVQPLINNGINVSLFIDPFEEQILSAAKTGAQFIELHTGAYSRAFGTDNENKEYEKLYNSAILAEKLGLTVNAGHGLNYSNINRILDIPQLNELNIGHSIISRSIFYGLESSVKEMIKLINKN